MIRQIQQKDLERIENIWYQESVREHKWMDHPADFWNKRRLVFRNDTINTVDTKFVFVEDSIIKGFITSKNNHIFELFVDHQYQRMGIGTKLIKNLMAKPFLSVNVYMLNHKAIKFYIKNDFVITKLYREKETGFTKFIMEWTKNH